MRAISLKPISQIFGDFDRVSFITRITLISIWAFVLAGMLEISLQLLKKCYEVSVPNTYHSIGVVHRQIFYFPFDDSNRTRNRFEIKKIKSICRSTLTQMNPPVKMMNLYICSFI